MNTETIQIVDRGRGPQLSTSRITVLDVFYYLHRGYGFDEINEIMPLSRDEFDSIVEYVDVHRDALAEMDRRAEQVIQKGIQDQHSKSLVPVNDASKPLAERVARLREKLSRQGG